MLENGYGIILLPNINNNKKELSKEEKKIKSKKDKKLNTLKNEKNRYVPNFVYLFV
jgi:hypothetical protein